jgi:hypothetical protein
MSKAGDVYENPVTGERGVARIGTEETGGELLVVDLYIRPGGAVMGEHLHPAIEERFTVSNKRMRGARRLQASIVASVIKHERLLADCETELAGFLSAVRLFGEPPSAARHGQPERHHLLAVASQQDVANEHRVVPGLALDRREQRELLELVGRCRDKLGCGARWNLCPALST